MKMKTKFLTLALLSCFAFSAAAQEYQPQIGYSTTPGYKTTFKKNNFGDNWFISLAGAGTILYGDQNTKADMMDRITINPQIALGKWFSPYFAVRLQGTGFALHGYEDRGTPGLYQQHNYWGAGHMDFMLDLTNLWGNYNEKKVFRFIPWVGLGYAQRWSKEEQNISRTESPTLNAGILTAFRLGKRVDLNVELQGFLLNEQFNRVQYRKLSDGVVQLSAGLTFKLGKTDFEVVEPMDYALLNDLNSKINALRAENDELSRRPGCPECPDVVPAQVINNYAENVVYFRLNSSVIDKNQQINIFNTAEFVKSNSTPIKVIGYADKGTGTSSYNLSLSEKRARAVAKELIEKYGINSNQITIEWKGSDVQPYDINNWNRVVIMRAEK